MVSQIKSNEVFEKNGTLEAVMSADINHIKSIVSAEDKDILKQTLELEKEQEATTAFQRFLKKLEIPHEGQVVSSLRNPDLEPIKYDDQTWGFWSMLAYWGLPNFSIPTFSTAITFTELGLNAKEIIGALIIANCFVITMLILSANNGSDFHIGFGLSQRMTYGIKGSYFGVLIRVGLSVVTFGYLAWGGGALVNMILDSFSHHYLYFESFELASGLDAKGLIGFIIFLTLCVIFVFVHPRKTAKYSIFACGSTFFGILGIFIYLRTTAGGPGVLWYAKDTMSTTNKAFTWLYVITIWISGVANAILNSNDYQRFTKSKDKFKISISLIIAILVAASLVSTFGLICSSCCLTLYGKSYYMPTDITEQWLHDSYSPKARAASFFLGIAFTSCQLMLNMTQNAYALGMDLALYAPRYFNIRRGTMLCVIVGGWASCPWTFYTGASKFLTVMSAFGLFVTPSITFLWCDYYVLRKKLSLIDFFTTSPTGTYWYHNGVNYRAVVVAVIGISLGLPGLYYTCYPDNAYNVGMMRFYYGYFLFVPMITIPLYLLSYKIFPYKNDRFGESDPIDYFDCFSPEECAKYGMVKFEGKLDPYAILDGLVDTTNLVDDNIDSDSSKAHEEVNIEAKE
ncbi:hypothetical protein HANVADRAFT_52084 [Hanseniaspora valbyensis NRRL Y-1626]|uniref:Thiamine transporter n=1 Tax=Hanseniaspora valbyensis NRRL Y-1626 TaxID=766949 RepID=A0A1B7TFW4_9ASCO|nr:hypothetical protein HANVADRAFT_52084 [Hanseniaspora valbyensis NRRL Y-1626]